jgi:twitching motility protein PilT
VIATMPTAGVTATIDRILTTLPREEREIGRLRLSEALRAIISQQLLPQKDDKGRVAAVEVLVATAGVREALKDPARVEDLRKQMADGREQLGTQTFDQHLAELVEAGLITQETSTAALSMGAPPTASPKKGVKQAASA